MLLRRLTTEKTVSSAKPEIGYWFRGESCWSSSGRGSASGAPSEVVLLLGIAEMIFPVRSSPQSTKRFPFIVVEGGKGAMQLSDRRVHVRVYPDVRGIFPTGHGSPFECPTQGVRNLGIEAAKALTELFSIPPDIGS